MKPYVLGNGVVLDDISYLVLDERDALANADGFKVDEASKDKMFRVEVYRLVSVWNW